MQQSSLGDRLTQLQSDLLATPQRISAYSELPCALFRYDPESEWDFRREMMKLKTRLENAGKGVQLLSLAEIMWRTVEMIEGLGPVVDLEAAEGWSRAQEQLTMYLSDPDFTSLPQEIARIAEPLDPAKQVLFIWRAAAVSPGIYLLSKLLDELKGRVRVPTILFFPGTFDAQGLCFMGLAGRESMTNYRAKIYQ